MSARNDGGPAFPTEPNTQPGFYKHHGMSLRDWFAGQVVGRLLESEDLQRAARNGNVDPANLLAHSAYAVADAMLAARDQTP